MRDELDRYEEKTDELSKDYIHDTNMWKTRIKEVTQEISNLRGDSGSIR